MAKTQDIKMPTIDEIIEIRKKRYTSLKWKIFSYLLGFSALLLIVLWLFQIALLPSFYQEIKVSEIEKGSTKIAEILRKSETVLANDMLVLDQDSFGAIGEIAAKNSLYVDIWSLSDITLPSLVRVEGYFPAGIQQQMNMVQKITVYNQTVKNNGRERIRYLNVASTILEESIDVLLYTEICEVNPSGESVFLTVSSSISPLNSTRTTLAAQFNYIVIIMLVLSIAIAFIISSYVSHPIEVINDSAKQLGKGNYDIIFEGRGYREISELSDTLNQAAKDLAKVDILQKELIANVSHDLRTPLTMICGYSEMIKDIPSEATPENMQIIIDESRRLTSLVNDLLEISKTQRTDQLDLKKFNLTNTIKRVIDRFKKLTQKDKYKISFNFDKEVFVYADESRILQAVYNLLTNALTYTGENKVVTVNQIIKGDIVRLEIKDTGKGISETEIDKVWKKYYQVSENHKRAVTGTGLGLAIVKENLELHKNINYGVESEQEKGANFWIEMPIEKNNIEIPTKS